MCNTSAKRLTPVKFQLLEKTHLWIHSGEGLTLETSVLESFTVANLPYRPCG